MSKSANEPDHLRGEAKRQRRLAREREYQRRYRAATSSVRDRDRAKYAALYGYAPPPRECDCPPRDGCGLCGAATARLSMAYDHTTGEFQAWLCPSCTAGGTRKRVKDDRATADW